MGAFRTLVQSELERRNWTQRDAAAATDAAERKAHEERGYVKPGKKREEGYGISQSAISTALNEETADLGTIYALALAFAEDGSDTTERWFGRMVAALGYPVGDNAAAGERRARTIVEAAPDVDLLERVAGATAEQQRAIAEFIDVLQHRGRRSIRLRSSTELSKDTRLEVYDDGSVIFVEPDATGVTTMRLVPAEVKELLKWLPTVWPPAPDEEADVPHP
jgi:hypothetical protein